MKIQFNDIFVDCTSDGTKIPKESYLKSGKYIIIDQGQNQIAGFTNQEDGVYSDVPAIIFGDHTRVIKYVDEPFFLGADGVKLLKSTKKDVNYKYLYYALLSLKVLNLGYNRHFKLLKESNIEYCNINTQNSIVKILDKINSIIQKHKKEINHLDTLIKARFVEMFGDPVLNNYQWEVKKLKDLSVLITNGTTPDGGDKNYTNNGIMFLRSQNIWKNRMELDEVVYISEEMNNKMKKSQVQHNDILITKTGRINTENSSLGRAALFEGKNNSANINGHVYLVRLNKSVLPKFVLTILIGDEYREYIRKVCVGGIDKRQINIEQVENFPIILPDIRMQEKFCDFVYHIDKLKVA